MQDAPDHDVLPHDDGSALAPSPPPLVPAAAAAAQRRSSAAPPRPRPAAEVTRSREARLLEQLQQSVSTLTIHDLPSHSILSDKHGLPSLRDAASTSASLPPSSTSPTVAAASAGVQASACVAVAACANAPSCDVRSVSSDVHNDGALSGACEHVSSVAVSATSSPAALGNRSVRNATGDAVGDAVPAPVRGVSVREHESACDAPVCGSDGDGVASSPAECPSQSVTDSSTLPAANVRLPPPSAMRDGPACDSSSSPKAADGATDATLGDEGRVIVSVATERGAQSSSYADTYTGPEPSSSLSLEPGPDSPSAFPASCCSVASSSAPSAAANNDSSHAIDGLASAALRECLGLPPSSSAATSPAGPPLVELPCPACASCFIAICGRCGGSKCGNAACAISRPHPAGFTHPCTCAAPGAALGEGITHEHPAPVAVSTPEHAEESAPPVGLDHLGAQAFDSIARGNGGASTRVVLESEQTVTFTDHKPRASVHLLTIPRTFIRDVSALTSAAHARLVLHMASQSRAAVLKELEASLGVSDLVEADLRLGFHKHTYISVPYLHMHALYPYSSVTGEHYSDEHFLTPERVLARLPLACHQLDAAPLPQSDVAVQLEQLAALSSIDRRRELETALRARLASLPSSHLGIVVARLLARDTAHLVLMLKNAQLLRSSVSDVLCTLTREMDASSVAAEATLETDTPALAPARGDVGGLLLHSLPSDLCPSVEEQPCFLCGLVSPGCVVCVTRETSFVWACNSIHAGMHASCARIALDDSPDGRIWLGKHSPWGALPIRCFPSGDSDVRRLGLSHVVWQRGRSRGAGFAFLPLQYSSQGGVVRRHERIRPLVGSRQLLAALFGIPSSSALAAAREQLSSLVAKEGPSCLVASASRLPRVRIRYSASEHLEHFSALVRRSALDSRATHEAGRIRGIRAVWGMNLDRRRVATFNLPAAIAHRLRKRMPLSIFQEGTETGTLARYRAHAVVTKLVGGRVSAAIEEAAGTFDAGSLISVCERWNAVSFVREQSALRLMWLDEYAMHPDLSHALRGGLPLSVSSCRVREAVDMSAEFLSAGFTPDASQYAVVSDYVTRQRLTLLQGPPGTGKSTTIGVICRAFVKRKQGQIMVGTASNAAADRVTHQVCRSRCEVLRLISEDRPCDVNVPEEATLGYHIGRLHSAEAAEFRELEAIRQLHDGYLHWKTHGKRRDVLRRMLEFEVIRSVQVICCTCVLAGSDRLRDLRFSHVILDEATQSVEAQALIPFVRGAEFGVLVGDHKQLGPVVQSRAAADAGAAVSLFERLVLCGYPVWPLRRQYRMHPLISAFPNAMFYDGLLEDGVTAEDRRGVPFPGGNGVVMWWHIAEGESPVRSGYANHAEVDAVCQVVVYLAGKGIPHHDIGVITPYDAQRALLLSRLRGDAPLLAIDSVDAFQGDERDYIVISAVRSNSSRSIGFVSDPRRLNVALTRARRGLVVIGDAVTLSSCKLWKALVDHVASEAYSSLLTGESLDNLRPFSLAGTSVDGPPVVVAAEVAAASSLAEGNAEAGSSLGVPVAVCVMGLFGCGGTHSLDSSVACLVTTDRHFPLPLLQRSLPGDSTWAAVASRILSTSFTRVDPSFLACGLSEACVSAALAGGAGVRRLCTSERGALLAVSSHDLFTRAAHAALAASLHGSPRGVGCLSVMTLPSALARGGSRHFGSGLGNLYNALTTYASRLPRVECASFLASPAGGENLGASDATRTLDAARTDAEQEPEDGIADEASSSREAAQTYIYDTLPRDVNAVRQGVQNVIGHYALATPALRLLEPHLIVACYSDSQSSTAVTGLYDIGMSAAIITDMDKPYSAKWFANCAEACKQSLNGVEGPCIDVCVVNSLKAGPWGTRSTQHLSKPPDASIRNNCIAQLLCGGGANRRPQRGTLEIAFNFDAIECQEGVQQQEQLRESFANLHGHYQSEGVPYCITLRSPRDPLALGQNSLILPAFSLGICSADLLVFVTPRRYALQIDSQLSGFCAEMRRLCDSSSATSLSGEEKFSRRELCGMLAIPFGQMGNASSARAAYPSIASAWCNSQLNHTLLSRRSGMPLISYDEGLQDAVLNNWRTETLCLPLAELRRVLPVRSVVLVCSMHDGADDPGVTHVLVSRTVGGTKCVASFADAPRVAGDTRDTRSVDHVLPAVLHHRGYSLVEQARNQLDNLLHLVDLQSSTTPPRLRFVCGLGSHTRWGSSVCFAVDCGAHCRDSIKRVDIAWETSESAQEMLDPCDWALVLRAYPKASSLSGQVASVAPSPRTPAAYVGWPSVPRPSSAHSEARRPARDTDAAVKTRPPPTSGRIVYKNLRSTTQPDSIEWRPQAAGVLLQHLPEVDASVAAANACDLTPESVDEQAAAYLDSCRKHFDPQGKNFLGLSGLGLPKEGDEPVHDPLSSPGGAGSSGSSFEVSVVLVCTSDGVLCRLRPDGEPAVLSAVRAPLEGEAYRTWADEERARLATVAAAATPVARGDKNGRGRGGTRAQRGRGGRGRGTGKVAAATRPLPRLDTSTAIQPMHVALRRSCENWIGGREVEEYIRNKLPNLALTKPFVATRYQSAVDECGELRPSLTPLRSLVYSVWVLELPADMSLSAPTANPREVVRPSSQLYHERLLLPHLYLGYLLEQASFPLSPFPEAALVHLPPLSPLVHTQLFRAPFRSLCNALSVRQHRLGTAIEAGLHAFGCLDAEPLAASSRVTRVAMVEEYQDHANSRRPEGGKLSEKGVARKVDADLEGIAASDAFLALANETDRHHLVLPVGRKVFAMIRDRIKTVESRLFRGASALVETNDLIGFVAEVGEPVLWVPVEDRDLHHSHLLAVRRKHGDAMWPGSSSMTDDDLDCVFWEMHSREFTRDVWRARFAGEGDENVVCWTLGEPLDSARIAGDEMSRARQHQVELVAKQIALSEEEDTVHVPHAGWLAAWARFGQSLVGCRFKAARLIQSFARRRFARAVVSLLKTDVSEGPVSGAVTPSFPEVQREEPPPVARS